MAILASSYLHHLMRHYLCSFRWLTDFRRKHTMAVLAGSCLHHLMRHYPQFCDRHSEVFFPAIDGG